MTPAPRAEQVSVKATWLLEIVVVVLIAISGFIAKETVGQGKEIASIQAVQLQAQRERDLLRVQLVRIEDKLDAALKLK